MGLTKQYLRYMTAGNFNIVASLGSNINFVSLLGQVGRYVAVAGCENILVWDMKLGERSQILPGEKFEACRLATSPDQNMLAVGYADGSIKTYDLSSGDVVNIFAGHHSAISSLIFDERHRLASGSKDTEIIVWDTVAECGLCRLSGHKDEVTDLCVSSDKDILISSSKDRLIKFWDINSKYCFRTLTGFQTEVWSICTVKDFKYLISGTNDNELQVWELRFDDDLNKGDQADALTTKSALETEDVEDDKMFPLKITKIGSIKRKETGRVVDLITDKTTQILACQGNRNSVELFHFCDDETAAARYRKRAKKQKQKKSQDDPENDNSAIEPTITIGLVDEIKRLPVLTLSTKVKSIDVIMGKNDELRTCVSLENNSIELYNIDISCKQVEAPNLLRAINTYGHQSAVKVVCFSSDNLAIATGSIESVILWNRPSLAPLRTIKTGCVSSMAFAPGDRFLLVGLKSGTLLIVDIAAGEIIEEIPAHTDQLWTICPRSDKLGCVTGGADKTAKFWEYALIQNTEGKSTNSVLSLRHTRTSKLEDNVLCVKISEDMKYIAIALLNCTVKIFYFDSLKLHVELYGHALPVHCMDISMDSSLIITGSSDRSIKIWGMYHTNCRRSLLAHKGGVRGLQFVGKSHYFFSCGGDGEIKQWDGDSFNKIITLKGHLGYEKTAYGLSVSPSGQFVVSCGTDRVLRLYERTDEPLVLTDIAEEEREEAENEELRNEEKKEAKTAGSLIPTRKTIGSINATDSIMECLDISAEYQQELDEQKALIEENPNASGIPQPPPIMQAFNVNTPDEFFICTIRRINLSDLHEALYTLPFSYVTKILFILPDLLKQGGDNTELLCNISLILLKVHHKIIISNKGLLPVVKRLQLDITKHLCELRDFVGLNLHIMKYMQHEIEESNEVILFKEAVGENKSKNSKKRQRNKLKRSILTLTS